MLTEFIFFVFAVLVVFYVPGRWIVRILQFDTVNTLTNFTISLASGISCFLIGTYVLSWLHASYIYILLLLPIILLEVPHIIKDLRTGVSLKSFISYETLILCLGALAMLIVTAESGLGKNGDLIFYGLNGKDGLFNSGLIGDLTFSFPPSYPGLSHTMLHGYHILYDFMLSQFILFFRFNIFDLFFRFFSLFTAVFYGLSGLTLAHKLKMKPFTRRVFLFLLFFAQGIEYFFFHWFHNGDALYDSGIVQPIGEIIDPSVLFSMSLVFVFFSVLFSFKKRYQMVLPILLLSVLPGIKVYMGVLAYAGTAVIAVQALFKKNADYIYILLIAAVISAMFYLPFNIGAGTLVFSPFVIFTHFMESETLFQSFNWILKLQVYQAHHNIPRIIYLYAIALFLYFVPSLGIRLLSLVNIKNLFNKKFYSLENSFWFTFIFFGLVIPVFFIQSVGVFNILQFFWITWIVLLIPTAFAIQNLLGKQTPIKVIVFSICIVILCLPALRVPWQVLTSAPREIISKNLLPTANKIKQSVSGKDDIMVVNRRYTGTEFVDMYSVPLVAALTERPMYYEPEFTAFLQSEHVEKERQKVVNTVAFELGHCSGQSNATVREVLRSVHVRYLLLMENNECINNLTSFEKVIQQGKYSLYKVLYM